MRVQLAPSILDADFARLGDRVTQAEQAGASRIHVDVMDGHFVSNISFGAPIVRSLRQMIEQTNPGCELELDGGINVDTAWLGVAAGANVLVAGSAIFGAHDGIVAAMKRLQDATRQVSN
jgi:pentose-5-phosphate-3-epimerase